MPFYRFQIALENFDKFAKEDKRRKEEERREQDREKKNEERKNKLKQNKGNPQMPKIPNKYSS